MMKISCDVLLLILTEFVKIKYGKIWVFYEIIQFITFFFF
jgi:hypothetical protein